MKVKLRTIMMAIAILGVALGLWRRHLYLRSIAEYHQAHVFAPVSVMTQGVIHHSNDHGQFVFDELGMFAIPQEVRKREGDRLMREYRHQIDLNQQWHKATRDKYVRASARPWLPVFEPDGTEPPLPESPYAAMRHRHDVVPGG